jgi:hypothetical protein
MRSPSRFIASALALGGVCALASTAQADVQFEPDPCVVALAPSYTADSNGYLDVTLPDDVITCPVPFDPLDAGSYLSVPFQTAEGAGGISLARQTTTVFNPAANALQDVTGLSLVGWSAANATYSAVAPVYSPGSFYLTIGGLNYRVVLARPFTVAQGVAPAPACVANLNPTYAYTWDQEGYFVVPDSVIACNGFTFNSRDYTVNMTFSSRLMNQGVLYTAPRRIFNAATNTFSTKWELRLSSACTGGRNVTARAHVNGSSCSSFASGERREHGFGGGGAGGAGGSWVFGRFNQDVSGAVVDRKYSDGSATTQTTFKLSLAKSFAIKRATDVTAKGTPMPGRRMKIAIHADRNWSFQNTGAPATYRRQTVLVASPSDRAIIKRKGKIVKRVKLSIYGNATTTVPRTARMGSYSVELVQTSANFAGSATVKP